MPIDTVIAQIDEEIVRLQKARALLSGEATGKGTAVKKAPTHAVNRPNPPKKKRRRLSPEGRARIAEAQKKRWAALKAKAK